MKRPSRDTWLAIGLLILLVIVTVAAAILQTQPGGERLPPLASFSSAKDGTRALRLWLEEIGHTVHTETVDPFQPPQDTDVALILEPTVPITEQEWQAIDNWVTRGGTLVLAGERNWYTGHILAAVQHYDLDMGYFSQVTSPTLQTPLMGSPPVSGIVSAYPRAYLETDSVDPVILMAAGTKPVLIAFEFGDGRVIVCTTPFIFTNAGLKEDGNAELVLNVVNASARTNAPGDSLSIWFDEWHHGVQPSSAQAAGPGDWLRDTPSGHAVLYTAAVIFVMLMLAGRRFGRTIPLPMHTARRAPLEHITAMANLSRRAGHRQAVLHYHYQQLKRSLGKRYRLNPRLPDDEYVARLAELDPDIDANELHTLLTQLRKTRVSESEMIHLAAQAADWLRECNCSREKAF